MTRRRQLVLFPGNRRLPRSDAEFRLHCAVADTLRRSLSPGWIWFHVPNGGARQKKITADGRVVSIEGGRLKRMGVRPGVSDIVLIGPPNGRVHVLELKRFGEEPDCDQWPFLSEVKAAGGKAGWADTYDGAIALLTRWGALRHRIEVSA